MRKSKLVWIMYLVLIVFSTAVSANNITYNYVFNGSSWVPWLATSDGRPKVDLNLVNITAGSIAVSKDINATGNISLGDRIVFAYGESIDNIKDGIITVSGNLNVTGDTYLNSLVFEQGNITASHGLFETLNVTGTGYLNTMSFESGNVTASYFIGDGSLLSGLSNNSINYGWNGSELVPFKLSSDGILQMSINNDFADDLVCTDCIGETEISDVYVLNSGDIINGNLEVVGNINASGLNITGTIIAATLNVTGTSYLGSMTLQGGNITAYLGTFTNLNVTGTAYLGSMTLEGGNITADYLIGDGSLLANLDIDNSTIIRRYNESWLVKVLENATIVRDYDKIGNTSAEIWNAIDNSTFARLTGISGENITSGTIANTHLGLDDDVVPNDLTIASTKTINTTGGLNVTGGAYIGGMAVVGGLNVSGTAYLGDTTLELGNITPNLNNTYSLGSPTKWWRDLYIGNDSLYIAGTALSASASGVLMWNGTAISNVAVQTGNNIVLGDSAGEMVGIGVSSPSEKLSVAGNVSLNNTLYVLENGNVGIGTNNPSEKLNVSGNAGVTGNVIASGNVTLGQKITFAFGEIIDNIVDGIIKINGNLNVSGSVTADSVTETNGVLKQNLITNSGFGVWSNSEDLYTTAGAVPATADAYDLVTNGDFDTNINGWELYGDSTVSWNAGQRMNVTVSGSSGGFQMSSNITGLTIGKLYEFRLETTDDTFGSNLIRLKDDNDNGFVQYDTLASTESYTQVFEATGTTFRLIAWRNGGTGRYYVDNISLHEVTPGITGANALGLDSWEKTSGTSVWREHTGTNTKDGSFYALKVTGNGGAGAVHWPHTITNPTFNLPEHYKKFAGRTVTFGCWIKTDTESKARIEIGDSTGSTLSDYHTGSNNFEWLEVTRTVASATTNFYVQVYSGTSTTAYISQPMLVFGNSIGEGNYMQPFGEVVWLEHPYDALSSYNSASLAADADGTINLEAESRGEIPKGIRAVWVELYLTNPAATGRMLDLRDDGNGVSALGGYNEVASSLELKAGVVPCDANGDIYLGIDNEFTGVRIKPYGIQVTP